MEKFRSSAPNEPKMTLYTKGSKVPHICSTSVAESHIKLSFALYLVISKIFAILNIPKVQNIKFRSYVYINFKIPRNIYCVDYHREYL